MRFAKLGHLQIACSLRVQDSLAVLFFLPCLRLDDELSLLQLLFDCKHVFDGLLLGMVELLQQVGGCSRDEVFHLGVLGGDLSFDDLVSDALALCLPVEGRLPHEGAR